MTLLNKQKKYMDEWQPQLPAAVSKQNEANILQSMLDSSATASIQHLSLKGISSQLILSKMETVAQLLSKD